MKTTKQPKPQSKKHLCIIIGASIGRLEQRIEESLSYFDFSSQDLLFIGTDKELKLFSKYCKNCWPYTWKQIKGKFAHCNRLSTWTGLEQSRPYWKKYRTISLYTEHFHALRIRRFFSYLGRDHGLKIIDTQHSENPFQEMLYRYETTQSKVLKISNIARSLRKLHLV